MSATRKGILRRDQNMTIFASKYQDTKTILLSTSFKKNTIEKS